MHKSAEAWYQQSIYLLSKQTKNQNQELIRNANVKRNPNRKSKSAGRHLNWIEFSEEKMKRWTLGNRNVERQRDKRGCWGLLKRWEEEQPVSILAVSSSRQPIWAESIRWANSGGWRKRQNSKWAENHKIHILKGSMCYIQKTLVSDVTGYPLSERQSASCCSRSHACSAMSASLKLLDDNANG